MFDKIPPGRAARPHTHQQHAGTRQPTRGGKNRTVLLGRLRPPLIPSLGLLVPMAHPVALPPAVGTLHSLTPAFFLYISNNPNSLRPRPKPTATHPPITHPKPKTHKHRPTTPLPPSITPSQSPIHHHDPLGWNAPGATPGSSDASLSASRQAIRMRSEEAGP